MRANGFTLIELMIGLLISMLCMIMLLMLFRQISQISVRSSQSAEYDAQIQTGLLVLEKFIQNAGYGSGLANDIQIGTHFGNPALFWRFIPELDSVPVSYQCQGVAEKITTENGLRIHRLVLMKKDACGTTTALTEGTWQESQAIVSINNNSTTPIFRYALSQGECRPFGINSTPVGTKQISLTAFRPEMTGLGEKIQSLICLNNIKAT